MTFRTAPYTQSDVTRAIKGAVAAGLTVKEAVASVDGVRLFFYDKDQSASNAQEDTKSWDELVK